MAKLRNAHQLITVFSLTFGFYKMREIIFKKYQGTGNDFILIDGTKGDIKLNEKQIQFLCHRKLGIGADGVIIIEHDDEADFYVNYYNSDGTQSFCGNGSRCSVAFCHKIGIFSSHSCEFNAIDGLHKGELLSNGTVKVSMKDVSGIEKIEQGVFLDTGSPHVVTYRSDLSGLDIITEAHKIRYNERFSSAGVNVNFISDQDDQITIRTYERGVEDETLSCGTGVTAVALSLAKEEGIHLTEINTQGGVLGVAFHKEKDLFKNIYLMGPAVEVFSGTFEL